MSTATEESPSPVRFMATLLFAPPRFLHELTHVVAARPWARDWTILLNEQGGVANVEWQDETPAWAKWLAHYAPLFSALALGVGVVGWTVQHGWEWPSSIVRQAEVVVVVTWWVMYGRVGPADRQGAREARQDG